MISTIPDSVKTESPPPRHRLLALDALRGLCVLLMLVIGNFGMGPSAPSHFTHAGWSGGTHLADIVFPWFLYCVGTAIPYSAASFRRANLPGWRYDLKVLRRAAVLFALGVLLSSVVHKRLMVSIGVLQIIAVAYAVGALLYDLPLHRRLALAALMLVSYWVALRFVPVPGAGPGAFAEGSNIVHHVNKTYLAHLGLEGLPLIVPTSALVLMGTAVGERLRRHEKHSPRMAGALLAAGAVLVALAELWSLSVPFNRPLWTSSYMLLAAGTATLILALFYLVLDVRGARGWSFPLIVLGTNAILAYVAPIVFKALVLRPLHMSTAGWTRVLVYAACWWLVLWLLHRRKLFLRA